MSLHGDKLVYKNEEIRIEFICLPQTSITHLEIVPIAIKNNLHSAYIPIEG